MDAKDSKTGETVRDASFSCMFLFAASSFASSNNGHKYCGTCTFIYVVISYAATSNKYALVMNCAAS